MLRLDARWMYALIAIVLVWALGAAAFAGMIFADEVAQEDGGEALMEGDEGHDHAQEGVASSWRPGDGLSPAGLDVLEPPRLVHDHSLGPGEGTVPSRSEAMEYDSRYSKLRARGTDALDRLAGQGHLDGSGTLGDPYVLERFYVDGDLVIESTSRALVVREGYVTGQMKLNYVGKDLLVHHVYAKDLRVNENVRRYALETGGLFHDNEFGFIGQLRHFSGEFRDNTVGPRPQGVALSYVSDTGVAEIPAGLVFNFDGFHGARVHSNTVHGRVDIKLHGHYHADCLTCGSHDHHDEAGFPAGGSDDDENPEDEAGSHDEEESAHGGHAENDTGSHAAGHHDHDHSASHHARATPKELAWLQGEGLRSVHSVRYHALHFHGNEIHVEDDDVALRYYDRAHRGDDETANSEPNPFLEDPHVHFQSVWIEGNRLVGGRLVLDVLNAKDDRHVLENLGVLRIEANHVTVPFRAASNDHAPPAHGIRLGDAQGFEILVIDNRITFQRQRADSPLSLAGGPFSHDPERIGIVATGFDRGHAYFFGNVVEEGDVGLFVNAFSELVWWSVRDNRFPDEEMRHRNTGNAPNESPPSADKQGESGDAPGDGAHDDGEGGDQDAGDKDEGADGDAGEADHDHDGDGDADGGDA